MKKKINLLIIAAILGLIALSVIQAYLINNTYKLEKEVFLGETKRVIFRFDDKIRAIDSIYDRMGDYMVQDILAYKLGRKKKSELLNDIALTKDSVNTQFIQLYKKAFKELQLEYPIKYQKRLKSIVLLETQKNDTLYFKPSGNKMTHLLGEKFEIKGAYNINNSQTSTNLDRDYLDNGISKTINLDFQITTEDYINIDNWKRIVLKRMSGILALSILIFAVVLGLLYYAIKSLITQKKIADVKTDFVNNITHELKTPLATLSLATKMLKNDTVKAQPEVVENTIATIDRQNKRLQKLIDQVVTNSMGYQDIELEKEPIQSKRYLNAVLDDFELAMKEKSIVLNRTISTRNTPIYLDKFYFTTALLNILENAVKYNTSNTITITINAITKKQFTIVIKDNGIGMSQKDIKTIFEKFYRAGNTQIHDVKGLGLGLYYTSQIIKAHNGTINVESHVNKGTTFIISIPLTS